MSRRNVERMDAQNRNLQNGRNPRRCIAVQVLSHPLSGTVRYSSGMGDLQTECPRSNVYG